MYYYAAENTGSFKANTERQKEHILNIQALTIKNDPFHYYTMHIKFGIGRASFDASHEVRNDKINREEAIALVHKYDGEFPKSHFKDFINYIDINEETFFETIDKFRPSYLWEKRDKDWILIIKLG